MSDTAQQKESTIQRLISEARRRHLFRTAGLYAAGAFVILQLADIAAPSLGLPASAITYLLMATAIGFPIVLLVVWLMDLSGDREHAPGRFMDAVIVAIALGVGFLYLERLTGFGPAQVVEDEVVAEEQTALVPVERSVLRNSIAVLPFENLSPDPNNAYFAAGVHEEVLNQLAKISDMSVIARTTMLRYSNSDLSVPDIGNELNVRTVMEGSVRYAGNRVRITAQLIEVSSGVHLWSEAFEEELEDIFKIQLAIATKIASSMKAEFSIEEQERIGSQITSNTEAYGYYLRALSLWGNLASTQPVHDALDAAIALDPNFAEAMAFKAWIHGVAEAGYGSFFFGPTFNADDQRRYIEMARRLALKVLELDDTQAQAHNAMGFVHVYDRDWAAAEAAQDRTYELSPNDYLVSAAGYGVRMRRGDTEGALKVLDNSASLNPGDVASIWNMSRFAYNVGAWDRSRRYATLVTRLAPDSALGYAPLALVEAQLGNAEVARHNAKMAEARSPTWFDYESLAMAYSMIGDLEDARRIYNTAAGGDESVNANLGWQFWMAMAVQDYDAALGYLERSVETSFPIGMLFGLRNSSDHPVFDPIRDDVRFQKQLSIVSVN